MAITALNDPEVWVDTFVLWSGDMPYYRPAFWFSVEVGWAVVGWAMAARSKHCPNATPEVSIFVQPEYRGFGFATKLFDRVMLAYLNVIVSIWDERSDRFYRRMDERYDGRVTIMNYWQGADR
jgi:GNAT superfamily N-acetyltransferase